MRYAYISADNHLDSRWLPRNLWQDRVAQRFKEGAPKVVETDKGSFWQWEGKLRHEAADGSSNARMLKHYFPTANPPAGSLPPCTPKLMLEHMDLAKIYAGVFYGDTRKWGVEDQDLLLEIYRAYNEFALETNAASPDRIIVLPLLPTAHPEASLKEFQRLAARGVKAVEFGVFDLAKPIYDPIWDPLFAAAAEAGIPLCSHIGDKAGTPYPPNQRGSSFAHFATAPFTIARQIAQIVFCGAFERHPKLKVSFAECRIGWLPFLISWMDRQIEERPPDPTAKLSMLPSEYIKRNVTFTFEEDYVGARLIPHDWAYIKDSVMWGSDYPHEQGTWPDAAPVLDKMFEGMDPALRREVVFERAARLFKIQGGRA